MTWLSCSILIILFLIAVQNVQKKASKMNEKWSQFECGFNLMTPSHIPFSFQFFLIAVLFLIFDVEIALVLSYPMETQATKSLCLMFLFMSVLSIGLMYEWQKSKINWSKWMGRISLQENMV